MWAKWARSCVGSSSYEQGSSETWFNTSTQYRHARRTYSNYEDAYFAAAGLKLWSLPDQAEISCHRYKRLMKNILVRVLRLCYIVTNLSRSLTYLQYTDGLHISTTNLFQDNNIPPRTTVVANASAKQPQSSPFVCWVQVLLQSTRVPWPLMVRTTFFVPWDIVPAIESKTYTHFVAPYTVSQCFLTGENSTYTSTCYIRNTLSSSTAQHITRGLSIRQTLMYLPIIHLLNRRKNHLKKRTLHVLPCLSCCWS